MPKIQCSSAAGTGEVGCNQLLTGIGIPAAQLPLLFEKFQQLDQPYRRRYQGIGIGLALTKQLVELLQGRTEVESTVGVGSSFTVWLPAISPHSPDIKQEGLPD